MDGEELLALAERVEKASGPDRELDYAILCVVDPRALSTGLLPGDPKFTASLDAAMTLVDDGLVTVVMCEALERLDAVFSPMDCYLTKLRLFVCAAALRARAQQVEE